MAFALRSILSLLSLAVLLGAASAAADAIEFDFKDPKGVNAMYFVLDSTLEPIMGLASGISGKVKFDPAKPEGMTGGIKVDAASLHIEHKGMKDHLRGPDWLDVEKYPNIDFAFKKVTDVKKGADSAVEMKVTGDFTCHGVTKEITIPVTANYLKGKLGERLRDKQGDLLVLRSNFSIKRKDFGIKPSMGNDVVAENIEIRVSIVGVAPASGK